MKLYPRWCVAAVVMLFCFCLTSIAGAQTATNTATATATATPTPTNTPTATNTPTPSATATSTSSGSIALTSTFIGNGLVRYDMAWTSAAGGTVNGNSLSIKPGYIYQAQAAPDTLGTQPTNNYALVLKDNRGVDLLIGGGAALSNSTSKIFQFSPPVFYDGLILVGAIPMDLVISGAGAAKTGTFTIWIGRPSGGTIQ